MPRSRLVWLQIADQQYHDLPDTIRDVVDQRLAQLLEDPIADPDAVYNPASDQWSVPLDDGFLFYAVVRDPPTVIILRVISLA